MAAKDLDIGDVKSKDLDEITTCCICTEVYTDPKALPCLHTFCMKCLQENGIKTNKGPGDEMPCPICRGMFKIPTEGFRGLPNNSLIEKLTQVASASDQTTSSIALCDACVEEIRNETGKKIPTAEEKIGDENKEEAGKEIPAADKYCVECNQKFCAECCRQHRKFKLTKNHKLVHINEYEGGQSVIDLTNLAPSVCELHEENILNVYCVDCKTVVCAICFIDIHKNHEGSHVNKFVDDFRKQIESNAEAVNEYRSKAEMKKAELAKAKEDMQKRVINIECGVEKRKDELKQFTDRHAHSLLQSLCLIRLSKLKEIQMETGDIDAYLSCLETYNSYCQKILTKGSASDICRAFSDLSVRAVELQEQCQPMIEREIQSFNFCLRKSELDEFLEENCGNLIGEIDEEGDSKPWKRNTQSQLSERRNEIVLLRKEIEVERTYKESLRLANEQLRINIFKETQASKASTEELSTERANYKAHIKKMKQELDNNNITNNTLEVTNYKLQQQLDAKNTTNVSLQTNNDKLKQEIDKQKLANISLQIENCKLKEEQNNVKTANNSLQASNSKLVQVVHTYKTRITTLEDNVEKLKQELEEMKTEKLRYTIDPVLVQTIRTKAAEEQEKSIWGLTILGKELFVVSYESSEVEVYDSTKLSLSRRWNLKELIHPRDIRSCNRNKCLYIFDYKGFLCKSKEILRVDPNGKLMKKWSTGDEYGCLSITDELNVILSVLHEHKLNEYSPDGQLIREINLSSDAGIENPWHAIKLTNGDFVVSHGYFNNDLHRVCLVDAGGKLKKSFGGECGTALGQMNVPNYLSVDKNGFVMVNDQWNSRVLLLGLDMEYKREILSKDKHGLRDPMRILLRESDGRIFLADNSKEKIFIDGRILIFDFKGLS